MSEFDYDYDADDYYDDSHNSELANIYYDDEGDVEDTTFWHYIEFCAQPTLRDGISHIAKLLLWCTIFRVTTQIAAVPVIVGHAVSAFTGLYILYHFFQSMIIYILAYAVCSYASLWVVCRFWSQKCGLVMAVISVVFLVMCELFLVDPTDWHKIRGAQMILTMKIVSFSFDLNIGVIQKLPSPVAFFGYVFHVGTCIFGPFISFRDYISIYQQPVWNMKWLLKMLLSLTIGMFFLTVSTCWCHWFIPNGTWKWWLAYRDALSFRSSHYFISFISEASAIASGFGKTEDNDWSIGISKPQLIEIPRSLVQVVVYWNMPMHYWLKTYIFKKTKPLGNFIAVISTYAVSSLLHGINFQLSAVLLSLGVYTYIEYVLRQKLASNFKACILVRSCRKGCTHVHRETQLTVVLVNICFGLVVMFHLAYLGLMFDSSSEQEEEGYSYMHTLSKWSSLSYASHWFAFAMYIFYILL